MAVFAKTLLLVGLVLLNTPHLLCPYTCSATARIVAEEPKPKCPLCGDQDRSTPATPTPSGDCRSGCCDQEPGVVIPIEVQAETHSRLFVQLPIDLGPTYVLVTLPVMERVNYWPPPPSVHPGSQLSILLGRFLL